eukprot:7391983-Prymnesium_polylepis.3
MQQKVELSLHAGDRIVARAIAKLVDKRVRRAEEAILARVEEALVIGELVLDGAVDRLLVKDGRGQVKHTAVVLAIGLRP